MSDQWIEASRAERQCYIDGFRNGWKTYSLKRRATMHWPYNINEVTEAYVRTLYCYEDIADGTYPLPLYRLLTPDEQAQKNDIYGRLVCLYAHWRHRHPECAGELYETIMKPLGLTVEFTEGE